MSHNHIGKCSRGAEKRLRICRFLRLIFFPASKPAGSINAPPFFCAFDALAINHSCRRDRFASIELAAQHIKRMMDPVDRAVICPEIKVSVNRAFRRQIYWYRPPLAAGRQNIHQAVDDFPQIDRPFSTAAFRGRDQWTNQGPLGVGQITGITSTDTIIPLTVFYRPQWRSSGSIATTTTESQMTHPIHIYSGQTLRFRTVK
jgi:hypothetical protein